MKFLPLSLAALVCLTAFWFLRQTEPSQEPSNASRTEGRGASRSEGALAGASDLADIDRTEAVRSESRAEESGDGTRGASQARPESSSDAPLPAMISGRLTDASGKPLGTGDVYVEAPLGWGQMAPRWPSVSADVGSDGSFEVSAGSGTARLVAGADGFVPLDRNLDLEPGRSLDLGELALARGVRISGRVIDDGGRAVEGAAIHRTAVRNGGFVPLDAVGDLAATTDASGRFTIARQAAGPFEFVVDHSDYRRESFSGSTERAGESALGIEVVLSTGTVITGTVTGLPEGEVEPLRIVARPSDLGSQSFSQPAGGKPRDAAVAADGSFEIRGVTEGTPLQLLVTSPGEAWFTTRRRSALVSCVGGDRGVTVPYSEGAVIRFRLEGKDGLPLANASVSVAQGWSEQRPNALVDAATGAYEAGSLWPARRDPSEPFSLTVEVKGYEPLTENVVIGPDEIVDLGVLRPTLKAQLLVTVVEAQTGKPVPGAFVKPREVDPDSDPNVRRFRATARTDGDGDSEWIDPDEQPSVATDEDGLALLDVTPGTTIALDVTHATFAEVSVPAQALADLAVPGKEGEYAASVSLESGGAIAVQVVDAEGASVEGIEVQRKRFEDGPQPSTEVSDAGGSCLLTGLAPGDHFVRVKLPEAQSAGSFVFAALGGEETVDEDGWTRVTVLADQTADVTLVAPTPGRLTGRVTERGVPLAGATLSLKRNGPRMPGVINLGGGPSATTDARGEFSFEGLKTGDQRLEIRHATRAMSFEQVVEIEQGDNELEVDLDVTTASGRVFDHEGKPLPGARVAMKRAAQEGEPQVRMVISFAGSAGGSQMISNAPEDPDAVVTDEDGRWELRGIAADREVFVTANADGYDEARSDAFEVPRGSGKDGIEVRFRRPGALELRIQDPPGGAVIAVLNRRGAIGSEPRIEQIIGGSATIEGLEPGEWEISLNAPQPTPGASEANFDPDELVVEVVSGETRTADFKCRQ